MDAYYDRGPRNRSAGFTPTQVMRANAICLERGHLDHMSDAVSVAAQTHAPVVIGAPTAITKARQLGLPVSQAVTVTGTDGEIQRHDGFTVEPILAQHGTLSPTVLGPCRRRSPRRLAPNAGAERR